MLKLGFTVGIIPSLNIAAGLIGFTGIKGIVYLAQKCALPYLSKPFTRQENTVIQSTSFLPPLPILCNSDMSCA